MQPFPPSPALLLDYVPPFSNSEPQLCYFIQFLFVYSPQFHFSFKFHFIFIFILEWERNIALFLLESIPQNIVEEIITSVALISSKSLWDLKIFAWVFLYKNKWHEILTWECWIWLLMENLIMSQNKQKNKKNQVMSS